MTDRRTRTLISATIILVAIRSYTATDIVTAAAGTTISAWLLYNIRDKEALWKSLSRLKNPFAAGIQFAATGFVIASLIGLGFYSATTFAAGFLFLGVLTGFMFNAYWKV